MLAHKYKIDSYLMENEDELCRLLVKTDLEKTKKQAKRAYHLLNCQRTSLPAKAKIKDKKVLPLPLSESHIHGPDDRSECNSLKDSSVHKGRNDSMFD